MKRILATLAASVLTVAAASAQGYPDDRRGYELGVQELNNSGQVGVVTLFNRGPQTLVMLELKGTGSRAQWVRIVRGHDCSSVAGPPQIQLNDLQAGSSSSTVPLDWGRLTSGNYNVVVFSSNQAGARPTACGHLYRS